MILNTMNGLLEENLEIEELEKRVEMMILSPELFPAAVAEAGCQGFECCPRDN